MGKLSTNNKIEVVPEAIKVAIGSIAIAAILYYLDIKIQLGKTLDINQTDILMIAYCAIGFCVIWIAMDKWFLKPFITLVEKRESLTVGAEEGVKHKEVELQEMLESYEVKVLEARSQAVREKQDAINKAKASSSALLDKTKHEFEEKISQARKELSQRKTSLEQDSQKEAEVIASQMVEKVLAGKDLLH